MNEAILNDNVLASEITKQNVVSATAAPTTGTYKLHDVVYNSEMGAGEAAGWVCTVAGTPGTWVAFGSDMGNIQTIVTKIDSLAAGADLDGTTKGFYVVPAGMKFTVTNVSLVSRGTAAGIDAGNTAAIGVQVGASVLASKTFSNAVVFPADLGFAELTLNATPALLVIAAGNVMKAVITQGATADLPEFNIQVTGQLTTV